MQRSEAIACAGHCRDCGREHSLQEGNARAHAHELMRQFERVGRLDLSTAAAAADPALSFDRLFAGSQGNMFGVLECRDSDGQIRVLRAFSSMPRGIREVDGWVPPILSADIYYRLVEPSRREIERRTEELEQLPSGSAAHHAANRERAQLSRSLLDQMQQHYHFHNFRGERCPLRKALCHDAPIPGGVGECCAPKLLDYAARHDLRPLGLAEFYWGGGARGLRQGQFYPACETRCGPLLGFLLCGLENSR